MVFIFSSGIIVIFCYCAIIANYEEKYKLNQGLIFLNLIIIFMVFIILTSRNGGGLINYFLTDLLNFTAGFIIFIMVFISILLKGVNGLLYNPIKRLIESY